MKSHAILVCDRDALFREALRNFLLSAGYHQIEIATTLRDAMAKMRRERYRCIIVGVWRPPYSQRRFLAVVQQRQPHARVLFLVNADNAADADDSTGDFVTREHAFSVLPDWLKQAHNRKPPVS
jgi:DNA-binding NtrC family response regulator